MILDNYIAKIYIVKRQIFLERIKAELLIFRRRTLESIMVHHITPRQIKRTNRQMIYDFIYREKKVSPQDIVFALRLSRPTVASNLLEMEESGLILKNGLSENDQIGKKAVAYSVVAEYRIAIGVAITRDKVKIIAVNLYGEKINRVVMDIPFEKQDWYYKKAAEGILDFISSLNIAREKILGIGFAMQGLVSSDGQRVVYGKILDCFGLTIDVFQKWLNYPCVFIHDMDSAALSELWNSPELNDAIYISLDYHVGGAFIFDRQISTGKHGHSATFEHIQAKPEGQLCYCGKRGCFETVCSMKALLGNEDPEKFFQAVRNKESEPAIKWKIYLEYLSHLIANLHLVNDTNFILGGHLAQYFMEDDIKIIYDNVRSYTPFDDADDYILLSKMPSHNITIGAALFYIRAFLENPIEA